MLKFAYLLGGAWSQQGDGKVQTHTVLWWRTLFQWIVDLIRGDRCVYCLFPFLVWDCMASRSSLLWGKQNSCKVSKVLFPIWSVAEELDEHEGAHIVVKHMMFYAMYDSICKLWCAVKVHWKIRWSAPFLMIFPMFLLTMLWTIFCCPTFWTSMKFGILFFVLMLVTIGIRARRMRNKKLLPYWLY